MAVSRSTAKKPKLAKKPKGAKKKAMPAPAPALRIARVAKGKRPQYFEDPATDKLLWMTVTLMEELSVARDRLDAVERLLDRKRLIARREIESFEGSPADEAERTAQRALFVDRVMQVLQSEIEEMGGVGSNQLDSEAVAAVES